MAKEKKPRKNGPAKGEGGAPKFEYDEEIAKRICFDIATTPKRLDKILAANDDYPKRDTFFKWLFERADFSDMYRAAKERQQDVLLEFQEKIINSALKTTYIDAEGNRRIDSPAITAAKLKCDNIKWDAARLAPRKYGPLVQASPPKEDPTKNSEEINNLKKQHEKPY